MSKIIMRHSLTDYLQDKVSLEDANDITPEGVDILRYNALLLPGYLSDRPITIITSNVGRTQVASKIIKDVLNKAGSEAHIEVNPNIGDIRFDYKLFLSFVNGGIAPGTDYNIQKGLTNFNDLSIEAYAHTDAIHNLADNVKNMLPQDILRRVEQFETCYESGIRLEKEIAKYHGNTIFVTHDGPTWIYMKRAGKKPDEALERGYLFVLDDSDGYHTPTVLSQDLR